jgi:hypothetical protein
MGAHQTKLKCMYLPAQSGKTRKVEELITLFQNQNDSLDDGDLNIFISANNKLLVSQTTSRVKKDLGTPAGGGGAAATSSDSDSDFSDGDSEDGEAVIKGKIFSWMCGKETGIPEAELAWKIVEGEVEMVVACANKRRMKLIADLLKRLTASRHFTQKINIWIDEADKSIRLWSKYESILSLRNLNQVTLVSATFDAVFSKYERLRVIGYSVTHPECYRGLDSCDQITVEQEEETAKEYIMRVIGQRPELSVAGMRLFTPGDQGKKSHNAIAEALMALGWAGMIINGDRKELLIPGRPAKDLRPYLTVDDPDQIPPEFNQTLSHLYVKHGLAARPFFITGYLCVQRGVTFQVGPADDGSHGGFVFDAGIIPPIVNKAEAYQTMARLFGNVGALPNYKKPTIFTDAATFARVAGQEQVAINLARMVAEEGLELVGRDDVRRAAGEAEETASGGERSSRRSNALARGDLEEFPTMEELQKRWVELSPDTERKARKPNFNKADSCYECSLGGQSVRQSAAAVRAALADKLSTKFWGSGITNAASGEIVHRVYAGYEEDGSVVFFLRWGVKA